MEVHQKGYHIITMLVCDTIKMNVCDNKTMMMSHQITAFSMTIDWFNTTEKWWTVTKLLVSKYNGTTMVCRKPRLISCNSCLQRLSRFIDDSWWIILNWLDYHSGYLKSFQKIGGNPSVYMIFLVVK